MKTQWRMI
jgi:hypothetical protein